MNSKDKIITQCDKMIILLDKAQNTLEEAHKIAIDYLNERNLKTK